MPPPLIRMSKIGMKFGPTAVLRDVSIDLLPGEVHVLAGENGAGKSTLIQILGGVHQGWTGTIEYFGRHQRLRSPLEARRTGVAVIYQELSLAPDMTIAENLFLGHNPSTFGFVRRGEQQEQTRAWLERVGLDADPGERTGNLSLGAQQLVEIAKALATGARVIVMDEPTSALGAAEVAHLFERIAQLKSEGRAIVYITHKMDEVERLADRITVLRDGALIGSRPASELPTPELVRWMVGRDIGIVQRRERSTMAGAECLRLENFSVRSPAGRWLARDIRLSVRRGEVVGLAGLQGSGVSELLEGIFGAHHTQGRVQVGQYVLEGHAPSDAIRAGLALVTADRKGKGLNVAGSIIQNTVMAALPGLSPGGWRRPAIEHATTAHEAERFRLKAPSLDAAVAQLSGGNQQKVVLAKWQLTNPDVLLLDEPARGVDIGAKEEIYRLIAEWSREGKGILLNSTEMPELLALSDRIIVMHRGEITAEFAAADVTAERVLAAAMGGAA